MYMLIKNCILENTFGIGLYLKKTDVDKSCGWVHTKAPISVLLAGII